MQTNEQKKKNTLLIGVGIVGGVLLGAGLATLGFKQFMKTDKAFDIVKEHMIKKYPRTRVEAGINSIGYFWVGDFGEKFIDGWIAPSTEAYKAFGDKILEIADKTIVNIVEVEA